MTALIKRTDRRRRGTLESVQLEFFFLFELPLFFSFAVRAELGFVSIKKGPEVSFHEEESLAILF